MRRLAKLRGVRELFYSKFSKGHSVNTFNSSLVTPSLWRRMASGDNGRSEAFRQRSGDELHSARDDRGDFEDIDDLFNSTCAPRQPSTIDDEQKLESLLKEVLAYRDSNVSSWIVENKVKNLCGAYRCLLKPHRESFLKVLACEHSVDHNLICKAAKTLQEVSDKNKMIKGEEQLKNLLTPQYAWLFLHIGRLEKGIKFLVDLRTDLLNVLADTDVKDSASLPLQQLNLTLKEMLSLWFSVGFLNLERITWKSPCEMLQKVSKNPASFPFTHS